MRLGRGFSLSPSQRRFGALLIVFVGLLIAIATRFVQDDAYISFRYAKNLVSGNGLVFNTTTLGMLRTPGDVRTEGYTNFLWTLLVSVPMRFGMDPGIASLWMGLLLYPLTLLAAWRTFRQILSPGWSLVGLAVLVTNYTFASYATGGLETQLQTLLFLCAFLATVALIDRPNAVRGLALASATSLSLLCRLDSAIVLAVCYGYAAWHLVKRRQIDPLALAFFIPTLVVIAWSLWRHYYYGAWLPNTFAVKVGGYTHLDTGVAYWLAFSSVYIAPLIALVGPYIAWRAKGPPIKLAATIAFVWTLYVIAVGGDFMEFRMGSVVYPFLLAALLFCVARLRFPTPYKLAVPALLVLASGLYVVSGRKFEGISTFADLRDQVDSPYGWVYVGKRLKQIFGNGSRVKIATSAAGAVPYYSDLYTVDMLGLNDADIARNGLRVRERPGHEVKATVRQLQEREVNLVIGNPQVLGVPSPMQVRPGFWLLFHFRADPDFAQAASRTNAVIIPLDEKAGLLAWYLDRSDEIDQRILEEGWQVVPMRSLMGE